MGDETDFVNSPYVSVILSGIKNKEATLFLGAGCSLSSDAPSTEQLVNDLKERFRYDDPNDKDLFKICQNIKDTPPYTEEDLREFVNDKFKFIKPSIYIQLLPKFEWRAIFTTNYDDLVEQAYRSSDFKKKHSVITNSSVKKIYSEDGATPIYKIMGTFSSQDPQDMPVLTRFEYDHSLRYKNEIFEHLLDIIHRGPLIFIGYSADDNFGFDALDEAISRYGRENVPYSYAIMPELPKNVTEYTRLEKRKILPLKGSFEDFMQYLDSNLETFTSEGISHDYKLLTLREKRLLLEDRFNW